MKIAFIDDDRGMAGMIIPFLSAKGYADVNFIHTPEEAMSFLEANQPDLVFLDINLENDISGLAVLEWARPRCPNTKFVMCSAYRDEYEDESLRRGAHAFIGKPTRPDKLIETIRQFENK